MLQNVFECMMFNIIKTNITHSPRDQMVSAIEHLCVGYYDAITKKKVQAHVNERNVVNYIMCPTVTKKLLKCKYMRKRMTICLS